MIPAEVFSRRVVSALGDNMGVLSPAVKQLMAEAWDEGERAAFDEIDGAIRTNPYRTTK